MILLEKSKEKKQERMEKAVVVVQDEQEKQIHEVFLNFFFLIIKIFNVVDKFNGFIIIK